MQEFSKTENILLTLVTYWSEDMLKSNFNISPENRTELQCQLLPSGPFLGCTTSNWPRKNANSLANFPAKKGPTSRNATYFEILEEVSNWPNNLLKNNFLQ
jgi:hypothetical protein